jgi:hypothetical protein
VTVAVTDRLRIGASSSGMPAVHLSTVDPTSVDDSGLGYAKGQEWINTTSGEAFILVDDTATAAVWKSLTAQGSGGGASTPTGTGFVHVTSGTQDGAARAIDLSSADVTGTLATARTAALTGDVTKSAGSNATTVAAVNLTTATLTGTLPAANTAALTGDVTKSAGSSVTNVAAIGGNAVSSFFAPLAAAADAATFRSLIKAAAYDPKVVIEFVEDFLGGTGGKIGNSTSGSGAAVTYNSVAVAGYPGWITLATGTTTTGKAIAGTNNSGTAGSQIILGEGAITLGAIFRVPTVSDGTDTFTVFAGFGDAAGGNPTDGVFLRYTDGTNSGKFQFVTRSNNTETATDTGTTLVAGTIYLCIITVNAAGTSASCTINGGSATTNTTNIPTGSARATSLEYAIVKSAGTTSRTMDIDLIYYAETLTASR